jgi:hypothetical protein
MGTADTSFVVVEGKIGGVSISFPFSEPGVKPNIFLLRERLVRLAINLPATPPNAIINPSENRKRAHLIPVLESSIQCAITNGFSQ